MPKYFPPTRVGVWWLPDSCSHIIDDKLKLRIFFWFQFNFKFEPTLRMRVQGCDI